MGRILAIDFGHKRVGLALSDLGHSLATPLKVLQRDQRFHEQLREICQENEIERLVVGLPLSLDGKERNPAVNARAFGEKIAGLLSLPVVFHDERFTTFEAQETMKSLGAKQKKRRDWVDAIAAAVFLQAYLDQLKKSEG